VADFKYIFYLKPHGDIQLFHHAPMTPTNRSSFATRTHPNLAVAFFQPRR
jgi:hypothetical protein